VSTFFSTARFGKPQILAGALLLIFIAECGWLLAHERPETISPYELARIEAGLDQWHGQGVAGTPLADNRWYWLPASADGYDTEHSPLWYLIGSGPMAIPWIGGRILPDSSLWIWVTHLPYVLLGMLLGASVWYVARRLYGDTGGYIALGLYCFSPTVVRASALWFAPPNVAAVWGTFGGVFTAIAVSHTLYAPREVVLWNWRRILLLGISLGLAWGSQFELAVIVPALLIFMLYLAPERKSAVGVILAAACMIALGIVFAAYFFHARMFWRGLAHARWFDISWRALAARSAYGQAAREIVGGGPVLAGLVPVSLATYVLWKRSRYFGNTAPLIIAFLFLGLRVASPHQPESVFMLAATVFLFVFVAGMMADLVETRRRELISAVIAGLLGANALWNLIGLAQIGR
jgi:hypothetical protein